VTGVTDLVLISSHHLADG